MIKHQRNIVVASFICSRNLETFVSHFKQTEKKNEPLF